MTYEQLEVTFQTAQAEWREANPSHSHYTQQRRYFFFAGSQFGTEATAQLYRETFGRPVPAEETVGEPV